MEATPSFYAKSLEFVKFDHDHFIGSDKCLISVEIFFFLSVFIPETMTIDLLMIDAIIEKYIVLNICVVNIIFFKIMGNCLLFREEIVMSNLLSCFLANMFRNNFETQLNDR